MLGPRQIEKPALNFRDKIGESRWLNLFYRKQDQGQGRLRTQETANESVDEVKSVEYEQDESGSWISNSALSRLSEICG